MITHKDWIHNVINDEQYAKEYKVAIQTLPNGTVVTHPDNYKPEYDQIAYDTMNQSAGTITHVCVALHCSKQTIGRWIKRHPTFREAINAGRLEGEVKFRQKIIDNAFEPTSNVNNGLIKLLANNVHGIEDVAPNIVINNNNSQSQSQASGKETSQLYKDAIDAEVVEEEDGDWGE